MNIPDDSNVRVLTPKVDSIIVAFDSTGIEEYESSDILVVKRMSVFILYRMSGSISANFTTSYTNGYENNGDSLYIMPAYGSIDDAVKLTYNKNEGNIIVTAKSSWSPEENDITRGLFEMGISRLKKIKPDKFSNSGERYSDYKYWFKVFWSPVKIDGLLPMIEEFSQSSRLIESDAFACEKCRKHVRAVSFLCNMFKCARCLNPSIKLERRAPRLSTFTMDS